jgi:hypothetical protein
MIPNVYAEPATREPRRSLGASISGDRRAWPSRGDAGSLVCDGTFALRRALWLASASPAWNWPERLGWEEGADKPAALAASTRRLGGADLEEDE